MARPIPLIDARWLASACTMLEDDGHSAAAVLDRVGLDRAVVDDRDGRIPLHKHIDALEIAAEISADPSFGLRLGKRLSLRAGGLLAYVAMSSRDVAHALGNVTRYFHVQSDAEEPVFTLEDDHVLVTLRIRDARVGYGRQHMEFRASRIVKSLSEVAGEPVQPLWVQLVHARPEAAPEYRRYLGTEPLFEADKTALALPRALLGQEIRTADETLLHILESYCREILDKREQSGDLVTQIEDIVARTLPTGPPTADDVARKLGQSHRTLSRRLRESGYTYSKLVDDLRHQLSLRYLDQPDLRLSQIAYLLGYSELSAFSHAFRRWTGGAPTDYRNRPQ